MDKSKDEVIIGFENNFMETGVAVVPLVPFIRDAKNLTTEGNPVTIPSDHLGVVSEVHLGIIIGKEATDILKDDALDYVKGYVIALNSKLRNDEYKKEESDTFATITEFKDDVVISNIITKETMPHPNAAMIWAKLNEKEVQRANLTDGRMTVQEMIEKASQLKTLRAGDLILSGTPAGSFFVKNGDTVEMGIELIYRTSITFQKAANHLSTSEPSEESAPSGPTFHPKDDVPPE